MSLIKSKKHLLSAFDEICIKENLVHDKHNGQVIGYVNLGDVNNQLIALKSACNSDKQQCPASCHSHASYNGQRIGNRIEVSVCSFLHIWGDY